jgi:protein-S-isoprenylcysteine O-methyltransferase Ste14
MLLLRSLGWLACVVYATIPCFWFLIHPWTNYWRARRRSPYRVLLPAWIAMWIVAALITAPYRRELFYDSPWTWIPALALFTTGFWLYSKSSKNFSAKQLGGIPEIVARHPEQRLVISGIRARVRHPVYLAHLCELIAWSIGSGLLVCYALTAFAMLTGALMIRMEDHELEQRFGEEYRTYKKMVPAILPRPH